MSNYGNLVFYTMSEEKEMTMEEAMAEIERLRLENAEYLEGWKRAKADYMNFKQEQEKRGKELAQFASMTIVSQLLPVMEYFRKAFEIVPSQVEEMEWYRGVVQIYKQLKEIMKGIGVEEYRAGRGVAFDPEKHEAVGSEQVDDIDDDAVSQEVNAGYMLHGKVVAPARVIVNKKAGN